MTTVKRTFSKHFKTLIAGLTAFSCLGLSTAALSSSRTISFYSLNTGESLTVTYKRDGRYIPSAMKKLNYILRDWRANAPTRMDPKVIDLVWELHQDLGSNKPIHLVSGYRTPNTNAMRRRQSRGVAKRSRHMSGQAIDMYFPDISLKLIRETALIKQRGGVGYYPRSRKPFVHIDTGNVRHWPRMPAAAYAALLRRGNKFTRYAARKQRSAPAQIIARASRQTIVKPRPAAPVSVASAYPDLRRITPPQPQRKPILVALAAPQGESWMAPSGYKQKPSRQPVVASVNPAPAASRNGWQVVKAKLTQSTDTLLAFVGNRPALHKPAGQPLRVTTPQTEQGTAQIVNLHNRRMTTASINRGNHGHRRVSTPAVITHAVQNPAFKTTLTSQHVWKSDPATLTAIMRSPAVEGLQAFSGTLFAKIEPASFQSAQPAIRTASADNSDSKTIIRRKTKISENNPGWIKRVLSDWGFIKPANAKTTRSASIFD